MDNASAVIISAVLALLVGLITGVVTVLVTRQQVKAQVNEYTQAQFKDIIAKRIEVYPSLWQIIQSSLSDRKREGTPVDREWIELLLGNLIEWHARDGIFLTQRSYMRFHELRMAALEIRRQCGPSQQPTMDDLDRLDKIWSGDRESGLATELKNDLGSYRSAAVTVPS